MREKVKINIVYIIFVPPNWIALVGSDAKMIELVLAS